jgi:hypothetical protein
MVLVGRIQNGVVVLPGSKLLPEGQEVTVIVPEPTRAADGRPAGHSILDIPPISLGPALRPLSSDDDLLGEMLEDRV